MIHPFARVLAVILTVFIGCRLSLRAASKTWDITAGDGATITGGTGTWTTGTGTNWNSGSTNGSWAALDAAVFGGTAGTVTLGSAVNVGNITFNAGTGNYTIAGGGNTLTLTSSTITANTDATISAVIAGTTGLIKSGAGTLTLSGTNSYTGTTTVNGGVLSVSGANNLGADTADVTINGGTLHIDANGTMGTVNSGNRIVTIGAAGATLDFDGNQGFSGSGLTGAGAITKTGTGQWTVSTSISNYTGAITISQGVFGMTAGLLDSAASITIASGTQFWIADNLDDTWDLAAGGKVTLNGDGGGTGGLRHTLQSGGTGVGYTSSFTSEVVIASDTLINIESSLGTVKFASLVSGTGTITKAGVGTLNLAGAGNTLSGGTVIQAGTITVSSGSLLGTGALTMSQTGTNSTALTLSNAAQSVGSLSSQFAATSGTVSQTITLTGTVLTVNQSTDGTYGTGAVSTLTSIIAGTGSLIKAGSAKLTLTGVNTYTGATTITAGTLSVGTIGNGGVSGNLGAASNAAGNLIFNGGTLQYTGATASTNRSFTINAGKTATFDITTNSLTISGATTATTGALTKTGEGALILSGANLHTGVTTISAGTLQFGKVAALYNGTTGSWTKTNITVSSSATLAVNVGGTGEFTTGNVTTLLGNLTTSISSNGLKAGSSIGFDTSNASGGAFTVADTIADSTGSGAGSLGVTKLGSNTLVLTGANTYSGGTSASSGTLMVNNSSGSATGSGGITVAAGAALAGTGRVNAGSNAIVLNGSVIIGDTTLGSAVRTDLELGTTGGPGITLGTTGSMRFDLFSGAGAGNNTASLTASDLLILYGDISLLSGASLIIDNPNNMSAWAIGDQWRLWDVTNAGTRTGSFALANIIAPMLSVDKSWSFNSDTGILSIVPEPGRASLLLLGLSGLLLRRRR